MHGPRIELPVTVISGGILALLPDMGSFLVCGIIQKRCLFFFRVSESSLVVTSATSCSLLKLL